ncbi:MULTISPECIES: hypothetical protein [Bacteroides]|uniref:Uncharacterized protein n=1 Tax=Bacteroides ovatus TaxID=28116 RepID=A0A1G6G276_BACOV|nr:MULTISPECIES: hypothetical protein [Bacteroides]SDB75316.1 hypothetical protein SAMN05192581_1001204 [Bacteroides ovatus]
MAEPPGEEPLVTGKGERKAWAGRGFLRMDKKKGENRDSLLCV